MSKEIPNEGKGLEFSFYRPFGPRVSMNINPEALSIVPHHHICVFAMKSSKTPSKSKCSICNKTFDDPHVHFCDFCKDFEHPFGICKKCSETTNMDAEHARAHRQVK